MKQTHKLVRSRGQCSASCQKARQLPDKGQKAEGEEYQWDMGQGVSCGGKRTGKTDVSQQGTGLQVPFSSRRGTREAGPARTPHPRIALWPVTRLHSPQRLNPPRCPSSLPTLLPIHGVLQLPVHCWGPAGKGHKSERNGATCPPPFGPRPGASARGCSCTVWVHLPGGNLHDF